MSLNISKETIRQIDLSINAEIKDIMDSTIKKTKENDKSNFVKPKVDPSVDLLQQLIEEYSLSNDNDEKRRTIMSNLIFYIIEVSPDKLVQIIEQETEKTKLPHIENKELINRSEMLSHLISSYDNLKGFEFYDLNNETQSVKTTENNFAKSTNPAESNNTK